MVNYANHHAVSIDERFVSRSHDLRVYAAVKYLPPRYASMRSFYALNYLLLAALIALVGLITLVVKGLF